MFDRRSFLTMGVSAAAVAAPQTPPPAAEKIAKADSPFTDPDFGFAAQIALGGSYYGGADPGKLLEVFSRIKTGDFESAYQAYHQGGLEARKLAEQAAANRHRVSAREAYLWAATCFSSALRFLDGTKDPDRMLPCWQEYNDCWTAAMAAFDPPAERLEIPYEGGALTGWFLRVDRSRRRRPLAILNTGADGLELSMYIHGGAGGLARGTIA